MQGVSNNQASNQAQVFALSAKVTVAAERSPAAGPELNRIDPSALARAAMEEELKRKGGGGGGGGSFREISPTLLVPYSMRLMNQAAQAAFEDLIRTLNELLNPQRTGEQTPAANFVKGTISNFTNFFNGGLVGMQARLGQSIQDAMPNADKLAKNIAHLANAITSAITSGLKKVFYTKDDTIIDPEKALQEEGLLGSLVKTFGFKGDRDSDGNARSIDAHLENIARQLTKWSESFSYPIKEFSKRWFKF